MPDTTVEELASLCLERLQSEGEKAIDEICAQHPERADEIRGMVRQLLKYGLVEESAPEDTPRKFGDFHKLERIGGGGMGVVYKAEQISLGRKVALKLLRPGLFAQGKSKERFKREVETISKLDHPGICTVYGAGEFEGTPYLAMRFVEGESLAESIARTRQEGKSTHVTSVSGSGGIHDTIEMIEKVARALHAAHAAGVMHRDIKPGNVMIDRGGEPVLVDFGLARAADDGEHSLTASGERIGTPAYMAPEQVAGTAVDRRADVYGLGVTLYECLTLRPPFDSESREALYRQILTEDPPDPRRTNRSVGNELKIVLAKAISKEPADRFATALDFAEELRRIRVHEPIRTRRPNLLVRIVRWSQRNRTASGILVATTLGLILSLWFLNRSLIEEQHRRAMNMIETADELEGTPELAFKLAREAVRIRPDDPVIQAGVHKAMFRLREHSVITTDRTHSDRIRFSPDGKFFLVGGMQMPATLFRRDGTPVLDEMPFAMDQNAAAAFSPDGTELTIANLDGKLHRYDLRNNPPEASATTLDGHAYTTLIQYSPEPDVRRMLVVHDLRKASLWDLAGEQPTRLRTMSGDDQWWEATFLPDGRIVAAGSLWDANGENPKSLWPEGSMDETDAVTKVDCSDGQFLAAASNGRVRVFDYQGELQRERVFRSHEMRQQLENAEFDPSGTRILIAFRDSRIVVLDAKTFRIEDEWHFRPSHFTMRVARFGPRGRRIFGGNWAGTIQVWDLQGHEMDSLHGHQNGIQCLEFSPDGETLFSSDFKGAVHSWSLRPPKGVTIHPGHGWPNVVVSRSGDRVVFNSDTGVQHLCDARGAVRATLELPSAYYAVKFLPDDRTAVFCDQDGRMILWDTLNPELEPQRLQAPMPVVPIAQSRLADGKTWLLVQKYGHWLQTWKPDETGVGKHQPFVVTDPDGKPINIQGVTCVDVSEDGTRILIATWNRRIFLIDEESRQVLWDSGDKKTLFRIVEMTPDKRFVFAASEHAYAFLWDVETGRELRLGPHHNGVTGICFSKDGQQIVTGARDGWIRVWDRATGELLRAQPAHELGVRGVRLTATGQLVTSGTEGSVRWWWLDEAKLVEAVEGIEIPPLTEGERLRFPHLFPR